MQRGEVAGEFRQVVTLAEVSRELFQLLDTGHAGALVIHGGDRAQPAAGDTDSEAVTLAGDALFTP